VNEEEWIGMYAPDWRPVRPLATPGQEDPADPVPDGLVDRITELVDRRCESRGPSCRGIIPESSPSEFFCSESCDRHWRAQRLGLDTYESGLGIENQIPADHPAHATHDHEAQARRSRPGSGKSGGLVNELTRERIASIYGVPLAALGTREGVPADEAISNVVDRAVQWAVDPACTHPRVVYGMNPDGEVQEFHPYFAEPGILAERIAQMRAAHAELLADESEMVAAYVAVDETISVLSRPAPGLGERLVSQWRRILAAGRRRDGETG
jgi:hypothetical protein